MVEAKHLYGKTLSVRYVPAADGEATNAYSLVSARIYGPNGLPTDAQRANTAAGHIEEVTSWELANEEGTGEAYYKLSFTALTDATPTSTTRYDKFYVAINYRLVSGGPIVSDTEQLVVYRVDGSTSQIVVSAQDVYDLDDEIERNAPNDLWTEAKIDIARNYVLKILRGRGYEKWRLFRLEELNLATAMFAAYFCANSLGGQGNPVWFEKAKQYRADATDLFDAAVAGYDIDGNDTPDPEEKIESGSRSFYR